jgi:hypothetical protein
LLLSGIAFCVMTIGGRIARWLEHQVTQCSNADYGNGVTCIKVDGIGGSTTNETTKVLIFSPTALHAIIANAYTCADSNGQNAPMTTMTIGDNLHNLEPCFQESPSSPFSLIETSAGTQKSGGLHLAMSKYSIRHYFFYHYL